MKKIQLSAFALTALGIATSQELSAEEINTAVLKLSQEKDDLQAKLTLSEEKVNAYVKREKEAREAEITQMIDLAVQKGKITADKKQTFLDLASQNFDLAKSTLEALPEKQTFSGGVQTPAGNSAVQTMEDFQKLSLNEQLAFKNANPDAYKKLVSNL